LSTFHDSSFDSFHVRFLRGTGQPNNHPGRDPQREPSNISGPLFMQYLLSLFGQADHPMASMFMGGMPDNGRMGDYVFTQEGDCQPLDQLPFPDLHSALDQIMAQIMENSNSHRPVPATEEIIEKLPRQVLEEASTSISILSSPVNITHFPPRSSVVQRLCSMQRSIPARY